MNQHRLRKALLPILLTMLTGCASSAVKPPEARSDRGTQVSTELSDLEWLTTAANADSLAELEVMAREYEQEAERWCTASPVHCFHYTCLEHYAKMTIRAERSKLHEGSDDPILSAFNELLVEFLSEYFDKPISIVEMRPGYLYVKPIHLQGEVLPERKLWEELEIKLVTTRSPAKINTTLILDGRFAAGAKAPKVRDDFVDFEVQYPKEFEEYSAMLAGKLDRFIRSSATPELACPLPKHWR